MVVVTADGTPFDGEAAARYEDWYTSGKGARLDAIEKRMLAEALSGRSGESLLEVGCGTGHFSRFFAEIGFSVTGVDVSPPMLETARRLAVEEDYLLADACGLPFPDDTFDVVAFVTTIEYLRSPVEAFVEAFRTARSLLLVGFLNRWSATAARRRVRAWLKGGVFATAKFYGPRGVLRLLKAAADRAGVGVDLLKPRGSWLNAGGMALGAFCVTGARLIR